MSIADRIAGLPWSDIDADLDAHGFALTPRVLSAGECRALASLYETGPYRSTIDMARHRFGSGEYKYFDRPLPDAVAELRRAFYAPLAEAANRWAGLLGEDER